MKEFIKKNFAVLLAFLLPILLIVFVVVNTYLPSVFLTTDYNFLYSSCTDSINNDPYCRNYLKTQYSVVDNKIVVNDVNPDDIKEINDKYEVRIFLHNTEANESREITLKEAQKLKLDKLLTSPDGVSVSNGYNRSSGFFPFGGGGSSYDYYLTKGDSRSKVNLINNNNYYYRDNFVFIGWVLPGRN